MLRFILAPILLASFALVALAAWYQPTPSDVLLRPAPTATPAATPTPEPGVGDSTPAWVFVGSFSPAERDWFREEMERVRVFFSQHYGVAADDFTVIAAGDYSDSVASVYVELTGSNPQDLNPRPWTSHVTADGAVVFLEAAGRATAINEHGDGATRIFSWDEESDASLEMAQIIAHEYFHVLQHRMAGESMKDGPYWLIEGTAELASFRYGGPSPYHDPYEQVGWQRITWDEGPLRGLSVSDDLKALASWRTWFLHCEDPGRDANDSQYGYSIAFLASKYLSEEVADSADAYVTYWKLLGLGRAWPQAFQQAFGATSDEAYRHFQQWFEETATVPKWTILRINMVVSEGYCDRSNCLLSIGLDYDPLKSLEWQAKGEWTTHNIDLAYTLNRSRTMTVTISLYRQQLPDGQDQHVGFYGNGRLVDRVQDATPVELTSTDDAIEWVID